MTLRRKAADKSHKYNRRGAFRQSEQLLSRDKSAERRKRSSFVITPHSTIYVNSDGITLTEEICSAFLAASVASSEKTSRNTSISPSSTAVREESIFDFIIYAPEIIIFQLQHNHYRNNICSGGSNIAEKKTVQEEKASVRGTGRSSLKCLRSR